jgi:hypothetical protein
MVWGKVTQRRPQEGHDTRRHRRRWCRSTRLSPEKTSVPYHEPMDRLSPSNQTSMTHSGCRHYRSTTNIRIPRRPFFTIHMVEEKEPAPPQRRSPESKTCSQPSRAVAPASRSHARVVADSTAAIPRRKQRCQHLVQTRLV